MICSTVSVAAGPEAAYVVFMMECIDSTKQGEHGALILKCAAVHVVVPFIMYIDNTALKDRIMTS